MRLALMATCLALIFLRFHQAVAKVFGEYFFVAGFVMRSHAKWLEQILCAVTYINI